MYLVLQYFGAEGRGPGIRAKDRGTQTPLQHGCYPGNLLHIFRTPFLGTPLGDCFCNPFCQCFFLRTVTGPITWYFFDHSFFSFFLVSSFYTETLNPFESTDWYSLLINEALWTLPISRHVSKKIFLHSGLLTY